MTGDAKAALAAAEAVVGYKMYVELVKDLVAGKELFTSPMTKELDRAALAVELARAGKTVALVSGGDPGVYAMAPVVFELARARGLSLGGPDGLAVEVVPGVPALSAAAALLGAPLSHDFASISLSDRLTPWEIIEKRLAAAAEADFVVVLYNPRSKTRDWQLGRAVEIIGRHRSPETPTGIVSRAMRPGETVAVVELGRVAAAAVDMQTIVIVGNSHSFVHQGRLVTPRGYMDKYGPDWRAE